MERRGLFAVNRALTASLLIGLSGLMCPTVMAQPESPPAAERGPRGAERQGLPDRPEMLRRFLERHRERLERQREGVERALKMLDDGASPEDVREALREANVGAGPGPGPGAGGPDGAEGGPRNGRSGPRGGADEDRGESSWPRLFDATPPGPLAQGNPPRGGEGDINPEALPPREKFDEMLRFIEKERPEMAKRLRDLRDRDPEELRAFWRERGPQLVRLIREQKQDPGLFEARKAMRKSETESFEAARAARSLKDKGGNEYEGAVARLREAMGRQFDARVALARLEIKNASAFVAQLSEKLDGAIGKRDEFLKERLEQALAGEELTRPPMGPRGPGGPGGLGGPGGPGRNGARGGPVGEGSDLFEEPKKNAPER